MEAGAAAVGSFVRCRSSVEEDDASPAGCRVDAVGKGEGAGLPSRSFSGHERKGPGRKKERS